MQPAKIAFFYRQTKETFIITAFFLAQRKTLYNNVTQRYHNFVNLDTNEMFIYLMIHEWKDVASYLETAWDLRTESLYCKK